MTNEEAIKVLRTESVELGGPAPSVCRFLEALDMAASALRQQECVGEANKALTLDELRKMDGEPVWVAHYHGGEWIVVHWNIYGRITTAYNAELRYDEYGERWLAYRQKPEEGTR